MISNVTVNKVEDATAVSVLVNQANALADQIRSRAFEIFVDRGRADGFSLDHWFKAEQDLIHVPEAHLFEKDRSFHLHVAVPGFNQTDLKVTALPNALIIRAESKRKHSAKQTDLHLCAFGEKQMFCRFELPVGIDTDKIHTRLQDGLLKVIALKIDREMANDVIVSAA